MVKIEMKEVELSQMSTPDDLVLGGAMVRMPDILDDRFPKPGEVMRGLW